MPQGLLSAYAEHLPRLNAEQALEAATRTAVGSGSLKKGEGRRITGQWERLADHRRPVVRPKSEAMYRAQMAGMGIGVKKVKKADG